MDEKDIEIFTDLMQTKNVSRTADRLFTTQSALTKRLQRLEADLGCMLFVRTKRGLIPTAQGEHILPALLDVAQSLQEIRSYAASSRGEISGSLRLGSSINYAHYRLAPLLKNFMDEFPMVDISVTTGQSSHLFSLLSDNKLSIAIVRGDFDWNEGSVELDSESICLVRNQSDLQKSLNDLPFIRRKSDIGFETQLERWIREHNIHVHHAPIEINDISACLAMVSAGIGWTVLPEICLSDFTGVREPMYFIDGTPFTRSTYLLYRNSHFELAQVECFVQKALTFHGYKLK